MSYKFDRFIIWHSGLDFKWHITDPANWLDTSNLIFNSGFEAEEYLSCLNC